MSGPAPRHSVLQSLRQRAPQEAEKLARRSLRVAWLKKLLPVAGALLLVALAVAPELRTGPDANRISYHVNQGAGSQPASRLLDAKYHGTDQQGQNFTVTAETAIEQGPDNVTLAAPMGDITLKSGAWLMLKSQTGAYHPQSGTLTLNGAVTLYRNDGSSMTAASVQMNMRDGSAYTAAPVQAQGPFGTLTAAHGFSLINRGALITFHGPATLILNQAP